MACHSRVVHAIDMGGRDGIRVCELNYMEAGVVIIGGRVKVNSVALMLNVLQNQYTYLFSIKITHESLHNPWEGYPQRWYP